MEYSKNFSKTRYLLILFITCAPSFSISALNETAELEPENTDQGIETYGGVKVDSFANKHILDPTVLKDVQSLTSADLNRILGQRADLIPTGKDLRRKKTNVFIVGSPEEVRDSFKKNVLPTLNFLNLTAVGGISDRVFPVIVLKKRTKRQPTFTSWDCGERYVVAGLNQKNQPLYVIGFQKGKNLISPLPQKVIIDLKECSPIK